MEQQYFVLTMDDHALASFVSAPKNYFGTLEDIKALISRLNDSYSDTKIALENYLNGDTKATHVVAYDHRPLLEPVDLVYKTEMTVGEHQWEHINTWGCPYNMQYSESEISQIVIQYAGHWYRCIRAWMKDLCYENSIGNLSPLDGGFWGLSGLLNVQNLPDGHFIVNNLLYVEEKRFDTEEEAINSFRELAPEHREICRDIFGDG